MHLEIIYVNKTVVSTLADWKLKMIISSTKRNTQKHKMCSYYKKAENLTNITNIKSDLIVLTEVKIKTL